MKTATKTKKSTSKEGTTKEQITIKPPNFKTAEMAIVGTAPYVGNKFSHKALQEIHDIQIEGSTAKKGKKREPKDFQACYKNAKHVSTKGWVGIPAAAFRNAMISACRLCGFQMTKAKLSVFIEADGYDATEGTPLVEIKGKAEYFEAPVRLATGVVDIRARPIWREWGATVRIRFDGDQFTLNDVTNLLARAGMQVGIGEGRPDSKDGFGMGWGLFRIASRKESTK